MLFIQFTIIAAVAVVECRATCPTQLVAWVKGWGEGGGGWRSAVIKLGLLGRGRDVDT